MELAFVCLDGMVSRCFVEVDNIGCDGVDTLRMIGLFEEGGAAFGVLRTVVGVGICFCGVQVTLVGE